MTKRAGPRCAARTRPSDVSCRWVRPLRLTSTACTSVISVAAAGRHALADKRERARRQEAEQRLCGRAQPFRGARRLNETCDAPCFGSMHDKAQPRCNSSLLRRRAPPHDQRKTQCRMMQPRTDVRWHMQSAHGVPLAAAPQKPRRTSQFSSHPRSWGRATAACAPELRRGRAPRPAQRAAESFTFSDALRQRGTSH